MGEVVYVVGKTVSDMVCCSHANLLVRALTGYIARQPTIPCLGGAAHAHISGLTCALADPRSHERAQARIREPTCEVSGPDAHERAHARGCTRVSRPAVRRWRSVPVCALLALARSNFACNSIE